jgi:hypothetical protein
MAMLKNTFRTWRTAAITPIGFVLSLLALSSAASALVILPGQNISTVGGGTYSGTLIYNSGSLPFVGTDVNNNVVFTGDLTALVYRETGGTLDFVYQFSNNAASPDSIVRFTVAGYGGYTTNADYVTSASLYPGGTQLAPDLVNRQSANNGDTMGFTFDNLGAPYFTVFPGYTSAQLAIDTNATSYAFNGAFLQDGGNGQLVVPTPALVPEPFSAGLLTIGFGFFSLRRRVRAAR